MLIKKITKSKTIFFFIIINYLSLQTVFSFQKFMQGANFVTKTQTNLLLTFVFIKRMQPVCQNIEKVTEIKYIFLQLNGFTEHYTTKYENSDNKQLFNIITKGKFLIMISLCSLFYLLTFFKPNINIYYFQLKRWIFESPENMLCAYLIHLEIGHIFGQNVNHFFHSFGCNKEFFFAFLQKNLCFVLPDFSRSQKLTNKNYKTLWSETIILYILLLVEKKVIRVVDLCTLIFLRKGIQQLLNLHA